MINIKVDSFLVEKIKVILHSRESVESQSVYSDLEKQTFLEILIPDSQNSKLDTCTLKLKPQNTILDSRKQ